MGNKTSPDIEQQAITMIAQGYENSVIARKTGLSVATIAEWKISKSKECLEIKKRLQEKLVESAAEKLSILAGEMLEASREAMVQLRSKLRESSSVQAAVILGILQDKYGMILGNPSQVIALKFQGRDEMLGYIKSGEVPKPRGRPAEAEKFITVEPEGESKPPRQIAQESRERARLPGRRGRPRIHPLPDPNAPRRGRGRPKRLPVNVVLSNIVNPGKLPTGLSTGETRTP